VNAESLPYVVFTGRTALLLPAIDGAYLFAAELQANADTASVLGDENDAAVFQRFANLPLVAGARPAESRFEMANDLEVQSRRVRQLGVGPLE